MHLEIITPENTVFEGEVSSATFPGSNGSFQILNNHAPIISSLGKGSVSFTTKSGIQHVEIEGGVIEVLNNKLIVLAQGTNA
jgi:F-type H+-transporting ATPase subunit epsilon